MKYFPYHPLFASLNVGILRLIFFIITYFPQLTDLQEFIQHKIIKIIFFNKVNLVRQISMFFKQN